MSGTPANCILFADYPIHIHTFLYRYLLPTHKIHDKTCLELIHLSASGKGKQRISEYPCSLGEATGGMPRESTGINHRNENHDPRQPSGPNSTFMSLHCENIRMVIKKKKQYSILAIVLRVYIGAKLHSKIKLFYPAIQLRSLSVVKVKDSRVKFDLLIKGL